jgi:radical SAM protein with 4Fe4S-binding SPASM domain
MVVIARLIGDASPELQVTSEELIQAVDQVEFLRSQKARIKHSGCIPQCFTPSGAYGCTAAITFCTIDPWGNVCPCNHVSYYCGNILKQSINEIWKSSLMTNWRNNISSDCNNCAAFGVCHGGCHAAGNLLGQVNDPLMSGPIKPSGLSEPISRNITYNRNKRPELCCSIRPEPFGFLLVKEMYSLPVTADAEIILSACNGKLTLQEILERFGQAGLNFVGALAKKGYVKLR